jgi:hypothetical protein
LLSRLPPIESLIPTACPLFPSFGVHSGQPIIQHGFNTRVHGSNNNVHWKDHGCGSCLTSTTPRTVASTLLARDVAATRLRNTFPGPTVQHTANSEDGIATERKVAKGDKEHIPSTGPDARDDGLLADVSVRRPCNVCVVPNAVATMLFTL